MIKWVSAREAKDQMPKCIKLPKLRLVCFVPCLPTKREVRAGLGGLGHKTLMSAEKKDVKYNFGKDG